MNLLLSSTHFPEKMMRFASSKSQFLRLRFTVSSTVSEQQQPPHRAISVLLANFSSSSSSNLTSGSSSVQFTALRRPYEQESRGVRVSVWWDFENCSLPSGSNVLKVAQTITSSVRINGIKGPITITAFGDISQLSRTNQEALSATGIRLTHVPQGGKNSADRSLITDLLCWVSINPPPAHLFLISSDRDFASILHKLRMSNYNILLAGKEKTPSVLCSAASIMWDWNDLVEGKSSTGKHFNHPPDGPYNSWYGHYRTPLLDPFAIATSSSCSNGSSIIVKKVEELRESNDSVSSSSCRPIPKEVVKEIGMILSSYPNGAKITELREELKLRDVVLEKNFYGHKTFLRFLLSMPDILKVVPLGDGMFLVHAVAPQEIENSNKKALSSSSSPKLKTENENREVVSVEMMHPNTKENLDVKAKQEQPVKENRNVSVSEELRELDSNPDSDFCSEVCHSKPEEVVKEIGLVLSSYPKGAKIMELREELKKRNVLLDKDFYGHKSLLKFLLSMPEILKVVLEDGLFLVHAVVPQETENKEASSSSSSKKLSAEKNHKVVSVKEEESQSQESSLVISHKDVKAKEEPMKENQLALTAVDDGKDGVFNKLNQLQFGSPEMEAEHLQEKKQISRNGVVDEVKMADKDSESRIASPASSESAQEVKADTEVCNEKSASPGIFSRVLKRFKFFGGRNNTELSNEAVAAATETQEHDELFAKDSFWKDVESFINSPRGFVVVSHSRSREVLAKNLKDEGPSSLKPLDESKTLDLVSLLISEKKWVEENPSNPLPFRVSRFTENGSVTSSGLRSIFMNMSKSQCDEEDSNENTGLRSRSEVLADCSKLLKKQTEENPRGYNMGCFKKDFWEIFGYNLDHQSLGYPKLQPFIETMPEVKIISGHIFPSSTPDPFEPFEELGPVCKKVKECDHQPSSLSADEDSDSEAEEEEALLKQSIGERKKMMKKKNGDETESDILQILNCWNDVKDVDKEKLGYAVRKEKLVDGILRTLEKKPLSESRV